MSTARLPVAGFVLMLAFVCATHQACVVAIGNSAAPDARSAHAAKRGLPAGCAEPHGPYCPLIAAVRELSGSGDRHETLLKIARSDNLTPHEEVHLVDAAFDLLYGSSDRREMLMELARRPALSPLARQRMVERIGEVSGSSERTELLNALLDSARHYRPAAPGAQPSAVAPPGGAVQ